MGTGGVECFACGYTVVIARILARSGLSGLLFFSSEGQITLLYSQTPRGMTDFFHPVRILNFLKNRISTGFH
jgi:hypothetical protein